MKRSTQFYILLLLLFFGISNYSKKVHNIQIYGIPVGNTRITDSNCKPVCDNFGIHSKNFTSEELSLMKSYTNTIPIEEILENPYNSPVEEKQKAVCTVIIEDINTKTYHLETFNSEDEAINIGAIITHIDACGACFTFKDLAVYAEKLDVGADVRKCATKNLFQPLDKLIECIDFTKPCTQIWAYNTKNTQAKCFAVCITNNTYNKKDGTLSNCLQYDEDKSEPIFKAIAGITRRNTGITNAICRFCDEVKIVEYNYPLN